MYVAIISFFGLIFVLSYGTNILSLMGETAIYDTKEKIGGVIFILWAVFIAVRYYLYVLFSEFTSDNKNDVIKIQRQTIFLSVMTILVEVYSYTNILMYLYFGFQFKRSHSRQHYHCHKRKSK